MTSPSAAHSSTNSAAAGIDGLFKQLQSGARSLRTSSREQRIHLIDRCADGVGAVAQQWLEAA